MLCTASTYLYAAGKESCCASRRNVTSGKPHNRICYALDLRRGIAPRAGGSFGAEEPPWRRSTALAQDVQTADAYGVLRAEPLPRLRLRRKHALLLVVSPFRLATSESVLSSQSSPLDTRAILACLIRRVALAIFFDTAVSCLGPGPRKDLSLQHSQTA